LETVQVGVVDGCTQLKLNPSSPVPSEPGARKVEEEARFSLAT